jgi:hypothetical protein
MTEPRDRLPELLAVMQQQRRRTKAVRTCIACGVVSAVAAFAWLVAPTSAPVPPHVPEVIARQRDALSIERAAVMQAYEAQKKLCWQKFAVNPCLNDARRQRRQALHPLQEQELSLNAQERLWRTEQRNLRLQNKSPLPKDPS